MKLNNDLFSLGKVTGSTLFLTLIFLLFWGGCQKTIQDIRLEDLNVILIVVDTLGIDYCGYYNGGSSNTPNIDNLAQKGVNFTQAYATSSWTKPSIASILTSYMPSRHKVTRLDHSLSQDINTLPEYLQNKGFKTQGIVSHTLIGEKFGFSQGFQGYVQINKDVKSGAHWPILSRKVTDKSIEWIDNQTGKDNSRFFLFVHYFDPHYVYRHHEQFDLTSQYDGDLKPGMKFFNLVKIKDSFLQKDIDYLAGLYKEEIQYTDHHIGRLISYLEQIDIAKNTLVIFVADHGEEFMERGSLGHGQTLYNEVIHIPFIFYLPGVLVPHSVDDTVSQLDIMPTLLSLAHKPLIDPDWEGISLLSYFKRSKEPEMNRHIFSEVSLPFGEYFSKLSSDKRAVIHKDHKLIFDIPTNSWEMYNLDVDPEEIHNTVKNKTERYSELSDKIREYIETEKEINRSKSAPIIKLSPKEIKQLKSLGYIQ